MGLIPRCGGEWNCRNCIRCKKLAASKFSGQPRPGAKGRFGMLERQIRIYGRRQRRRENSLPEIGGA